MFASELRRHTLTDGPLPLLGRRHVEDVALIPRVGFVVGLDVYGELLDKRTGVSRRHTKEKWVKGVNPPLDVPLLTSSISFLSP